MSSERAGGGGFSLIEVLVALALATSVGAMAASVALNLSRLGRLARAEVGGLVAATEKMEELMARDPASRAAGNDTVEVGGTKVHRVWRVHRADPVAGLMRIEVDARWEHPEVRILGLVGVAR